MQVTGLAKEVSQAKETSKMIYSKRISESRIKAHIIKFPIKDKSKKIQSQSLIDRINKATKSL